MLCNTSDSTILAANRRNILWLLVFLLHVVSVPEGGPRAGQRWSLSCPVREEREHYDGMGTALELPGCQFYGLRSRGFVLSLLLLQHLLLGSNSGFDDKAAEQ